MCLSGRNGRSSNLQQRLRCCFHVGRARGCERVVSVSEGALSHQSCLSLFRRRFSFLVCACLQQRLISSHQTSHTATVPLHGSRSLAASLPCRATGWLRACACLCVRSLLSPTLLHCLYLTSLPALPACQPASEVLATASLPAAPPTFYLHYYWLRQTLPACLSHHSTQPAISRTIASAARISSTQSIAAGPRLSLAATSTLAPLLCLPAP